MNGNSRWAAAAALALFLTLTTVDAAEGQRRGRQQGTPDVPWSSVLAGAGIGYDGESNGTFLQTHFRIPLLRSGRLELIPSGSITFITNLREYQYNADLVYVTGGQSGGIYVGGGIGWRNSIFGPNALTPRETLRGYNAIFGLRSGAGGEFGVQIEARWTFLSDTEIDPRTIAFGINFPITNRGVRGPGR